MKFAVAKFNKLERRHRKVALTCHEASLGELNFGLS